MWACVTAWQTKGCRAMCSKEREGVKMNRNQKIKAAAVLSAVLLLAGIALAMFGSGEVAQVTETEELPTAFKPYVPTEEPSLPEPDAQKIVRRDTPDGVPEGFEEPEGGGGVMVLEETHAPQPEVPKFDVIPGLEKAEKRDLSVMMRQRYGTKQQHMLLKQMNADLASGKIKPFDTSTIMDGKSGHISGEDGRVGIRKKLGPVPTIEQKLESMGIKKQK